MINVDLLEQTMAHIEAHPDEHNQASWVCGTSYCFAGWAAILAGAQRPPKDADWHWWVEPGTGAFRDSRGPDYVPIDDYARQALGLRPLQKILFDEAWSRPALRAMVDHLKVHPDAGWDALTDVGEATEDAARDVGIGSGRVSES